MNDENTPWRYKPDNGDKPAESEEDTTEAPATKQPTAQTVSWEAAEYIDRHHPPAWYVMLAISTIVLTAVIYLLTGRDKAALVIIPLLGIIVGAFAGQKPRVIKYEISDSGLRVGDKIYSYNDFKSFTVIREGALSSLNLFPLKRLMPPVSAYFEADDEQKIVNTLGNYLPYEERKLDSIERLSRRLRL